MGGGASKTGGLPREVETGQPALREVRAEAETRNHVEARSQ